MGKAVKSSFWKHTMDECQDLFIEEYNEELLLPIFGKPPKKDKTQVNKKKTKKQKKELEVIIINFNCFYGDCIVWIVKFLLTPFVITLEYKFTKSCWKYFILVKEG